MVIYNSIIKHGYDAFQVMILEYCDREVLREREQHYIDTLKPRYNVLGKAGSSLGFKHSLKTRLKFKNRKFTEETRLKLSTAAKWRVLTPETKEKISKHHKGKEKSLETKMKISETRTAKYGKKVEVTNLETGAINQYDSLTLAGKALGVSRPAVSNVVDTGKRLKKIYVIKYLK